MKKREYDESDVKIRPKRSSRPRTKDRPNYENAQVGLVIETDRGRAQVLLDNHIVLNAMKARELGKGSVVVGDKVKVVGELSGEIGTLARMVKVEDRKNSLSRTIEDGGDNEKTIVANVDNLGIVIAAHPEPKIGLVDRALVVAYDQGIKPAIIVTKTDLAKADNFLKNYADLDILTFAVNRESNIEKLTQFLDGKVTVFFGHSGVGKSTLVNRIAGAKLRDTGGVNEVTGRGRHTSSNASAIELENYSPGTWIIDTPGVRSFGVSHINPDRIYGAFPELNQYLIRCPKNCSHNEVDCALNLIEAGSKAAARRDSLRRILLS